MANAKTAEWYYAQGQKDARKDNYNSPRWNFLNALTATKEQLEENERKARSYDSGYQYERKLRKMKRYWWL